MRGCKRWVSWANYARYVRACGRVEAEEGGCWGAGGWVWGGQVRMVTCGGCGKEMRAGNLARHQRVACRVWDPGGGQTPDGGRRPKWMDGDLEVLPGWLPPSGGSGSARGCLRCVKTPPRPRGPLQSALERVPG